MDIIEGSATYKVGIENELRFSAGEKSTVSLEVMSGIAEISGSELSQNKVYTFSPYSSVSLFSWKGCRVKLRGKPEKVSISAKTLMMVYVNIHACLEEMRMIAHSRNIKGPISLVVGPMQTGKTSLCRLLSNYAARMGRRPLYIDLDVINNSCSIPSSISILPVESPFCVTNEFIRGAPLSVYTFGYSHPRKNVKLYYLLIKKLGDMLQAHLEAADPKIRCSGIIIDTCGCVRGFGYKAVTLAAHAFQVDVVFVVQDENLYSLLDYDLPRCVRVVYVPNQSRNIVEVRKRSLLREDMQSNKILEYFYGSSEAPLKPHKVDVNFSEVEIYGTKKQDPNESYDISNAFRICFEDVAVAPVPIGPELLNQVLGLSFADTVDENLIVTSVKGFVCVIGLNMDEKILTVLSPQPSPLPSKILIMGDIKLTCTDK